MKIFFQRVWAFILSIITIIASWFGINIKKPDPTPVDPPTSIVEETTTTATTMPITTTTTTTTKPTTTTTTTTTVKPTTTTTTTTTVKPTTTTTTTKSTTTTTTTKSTTTTTTTSGPTLKHTTWNPDAMFWDYYESIRTLNYNKNRHIPTSLETEVFDRINYERAKAGVSEISYAYYWYDLAYTRAYEASINWAHERPDGRPCSTVFKDEEIKYSYFGENLGRNYTNAADLVNGFYNSPSHKACMLNSKYKTMTVACYTAPNNVNYYAVLFIG